MDQRFKEAVESLADKLELLKASAPHQVGAKGLPESGVYLFCEDDVPLYVGRSRNIPRRYHDHSRPSSGTNKAAFAVLLACEEMKWERGYTKGARDRRDGNPTFQECFARAKERVRKMEFRAVEECDPTRQALLEIYCAVALRARHNSFETH